MENYNGEKISKKPDLVFHLQRENALRDQRQDAIFAECKPVDRDHSLSANYCAVGTDRVGVERFIIGDYAWAMHEAMMIGYVRGAFRIHPDLATSLADSQRHELLGSPTIPVALLAPEMARNPCMKPGTFGDSNGSKPAISPPQSRFTIHGTIAGNHFSFAMSATETVARTALQPKGRSGARPSKTLSKKLA